MQTSDEPDSVRLDKWLWAARFYKTRSLATEAVGGGKAHVNGEHAKPSKHVRVGDEVRVRVETSEFILIVRGLSERRGPAAAAQALYDETPESREVRERLATQARLAPAAFVYEDKGRPTKKDRRELSRFIDRKRR